MPVPNPATRREHAGAAVPTTLATSMSSIDTSFQIASGTGWPTGATGPFFVVIDPGTGTEEKVLCSSRTSTVVAVAGSGRGADNTAAATHSSNAVCYPCWTAAEADELNAHAAATADVHGISGALASASSLAGKQPLDATLTALAALDSVVGFMVETAADTFIKRVLAATNSAGTALGLTNPAGTAGNPTFNFDPSLLSGVPQAAITGLAAALAALQPLDATLTALAGLNATAGIVIETAADTFTKRSVTSPNATMTITNPTMAAGNLGVDWLDSGASGSGIAAGTNFGINAAQGRVYGGLIASLYVNVSGTVGGTLDATTKGNLSNTTIATIPASLRPARDLRTTGRAREAVNGGEIMIGVEIQAGGNIVVTDTLPSGSLDLGAAGAFLVTETYALGAP